MKTKAKCSICGVPVESRVPMTFCKCPHCEGHGGGYVMGCKHNSGVILPEVGGSVLQYLPKFSSLSVLLEKRKKG